MVVATKQRQVILQKYYVYDPALTAGDELGGQRVRIDDDDKGNYILATPLQVQYWIDQGLLGFQPVGEISDSAKKLLAQVTRGRSENPDDLPTRVPRYDRRTQSGSPSFAGQPASAKKRMDRRRKRKQERQQDRQQDRKPSKQPEPKQAPVFGTPAE